MKIEDILEQSIEEVKAGRYSIEECMARYPQMHRELEPLLRTALLIGAPPDVKPSTRFKIQARVRLMEQISSRQNMTKATGRFLPAISIFNHAPKIAVAIIAVVLALFSVGGSTVHASQDSLPGDTLYSVKLVSEQIRVALTFSSSEKTELYLSLAENRIEEMAALADSNRTKDVGNAAEGFEKALGRALSEAGESAAFDQPRLFETLSLATPHYLTVLDSVYDSVPKAAKTGVKAAREASIKNQQSALRALAKDNPSRAVEINLATMDGRLDRATSSGEAQDSAGLEAALQEYENMQQFGQDIAEIAQGLGQDVTSIGQLVAAATTKHLEILAAVYEKVPEQARSAIENAMSNAAAAHGKAAKFLEDNGGGEDTTRMPALPPSVPENVRQKLEDAFSNKSSNGLSDEKPGNSNGKGNK
jgi:hypothetical protein